MASSKVAHLPRFPHSLSSPIPTATAAVPIKSSHHASNHRSHHQPHSLGTNNGTYRVTRRKSMSSSAVSQTVAAAAIKEAEANGVLEPAPVKFDLKDSQAVLSPGLEVDETRSQSLGDYPSPPSSLPTQGPVSALSSGFRKTGFGSSLLNEPVPENAIAEEVDSSLDLNTGNNSIGRKARRTSDTADDGSHIKGDLRCDQCGKGYKHSSCLSKHLWEHTPEWHYTSKLLISKHQQVQLLEAASILVSMKPDTPPASASSTSSYGMMRESSNDSNSEDSPPPMQERATSPRPLGRSRAISQSGGQPIRRQSSHSRPTAPYSRSYQNPPMGTSFGGKTITPVASPGVMRPVQIPSGALLSPRSISSEHQAGQQDTDSLTAAVQMLSCSFGGTPVLGPSTTGLKAGDIPSLPSLSSPPNNISNLGSPKTFRQDFITSNLQQQQRQIRGPIFGNFSNQRTTDIDMDEIDHESAPRSVRSSSYRGRFKGPEVVLENEDEHQNLRALPARWREPTPSTISEKHEDDDGVFGKMEE